jgi:hypothetical protein
MGYGGGRIHSSEPSVLFDSISAAIGGTPPKKCCMGAAIHLHIHNRGHKRAVLIGSGCFYYYHGS